MEVLHMFISILSRFVCVAIKNTSLDQLHCIYNFHNFSVFKAHKSLQICVNNTFPLHKQLLKFLSIMKQNQKREIKNSPCPQERANAISGSIGHSSNVLSRTGWLSKHQLSVISIASGIVLLVFLSRSRCSVFYFSVPLCQPAFYGDVILVNWTCILFAT